ncbi:MAG: DUF2339 domain-containing protein [Phycisphaerae bacterium]|nr:DUF2339 domain-containing protein [Phycisphaerae bacterium]
MGTRWLNRIGVVVLILAGAFFFQYAAQQGWISPPIRVAIVAAVGAAMLVAGEWTLRKDMRIFSAGVTGGGVAFLYGAVYAAGPEWYALVPLGVAFAAVCVATVIGAVLAVRSGMISTAILTQVGAYVLPLLLTRGRGDPHTLMGYMVAVAAGYLVVAMVKRWSALGPIALAGTVVLFGAWLVRSYDASDAPAVAAWAWTLLVVFTACAAAGDALGRLRRSTAVGLTAASAALLAVLVIPLGDDLGAHAGLGQLLALDAVVLGVCLWRRWQWLRAGAVAWTILVTWALHANPDLAAAGWQLWCPWVWALFGLFVTEALVRAWTPERGRGALSTAISSAVTAAMFWATYSLLKEPFAEWMGLYTAGLSAGLGVLGFAVLRGARWRMPAYAYFVQALVLLTLAMPIQFDRSSLTIAWAAQAAATMVFARRLRSRLLLAKSAVVLLLAVGHFLGVDLFGPNPLGATAFTLGGVAVGEVMLLAAGIAVAGMFAGAWVGAGRRVFPGVAEELLGCALAALGALAWMVASFDQLPPLTATWSWLALCGAWAAVGAWRRAKHLTAAAGLLLAATAVKYVLYDTASGDLLSALAWSGPARVALNWQFALGVALAAAAVGYARAVRRRLSERLPAGALSVAAAVVAACVGAWSGTLEIHRYFAATQAQFAVPVAQAEQVAYSVFWAVYAGGLVAAGFVWRRPDARYLGLGLFALTVGKVFIVDTAGVEVGYRIASFVALGTLLISASLLYQRFFRTEESHST